MAYTYDIEDDKWSIKEKIAVSVFVSVFLIILIVGTALICSTPQPTPTVETIHVTDKYFAHGTNIVKTQYGEQFVPDYNIQLYNKFIIGNTYNVTTTESGQQITGIVGD